MTQAMKAPKTPVACPNFDGKVKIPDPTIEPMTRAIRATSDNFRSDEAGIMLIREIDLFVGLEFFSVDRPISIDLTHRKQSEYPLMD